jgi:negative regulator of flagellin synthesis FlgM
MSISQVNAQSMNLRALAALRSNSAASNAATASGAARQADSVTLSDAARAISTAKASVSDAADVREDKVAALKAAIANGTYSVDSRSLAKSMLRHGLAAS